MNTAHIVCFFGLSDVAGADDGLRRRRRRRIVQRRTRPTPPAVLSESYTPPEPVVPLRGTVEPLLRIPQITPARIQVPPIGPPPPDIRAARLTRAMKLVALLSRLPDERE